MKPSIINLIKQTTLYRLAGVLVIAGTVLIFSCNKSSGVNQDTTGNSATDLQTQADDQAQVSNESDAIVDDANTALNSQSSVSGSGSQVSSVISTMSTVSANSTAGNDRILSTSLICDASVVWGDSAGLRTITITYNGTNCWGNRTRTGVVVITIPDGVYWRNAGAAVTVNIENLTITRLRDNKTIVINGTKTITNTSGGLLVDLPTLDSITHTITGSLTIGFPNGTRRSWNVSKQRVFSYNDGVVITTTGTHSDDNGNTDVAEWGTNRFGVSFESLITQPKVIAQSCDYRLVSGQNEVLRSDNITSTITYGLDSNGNPSSCPGTGTYYFKLVVTKPNGNTYTYILPY
ncbi:MAG: hypothetical protein P4L51_26255 [Puia sp.]|nr:hypothetical protein [Puia sp.]